MLPFLQDQRQVRPPLHPPLPHSADSQTDCLRCGRRTARRQRYTEMGGDNRDCDSDTDHRVSASIQLGVHSQTTNMSERD